MYSVVLTLLNVFMTLESVTKKNKKGIRRLHRIDIARNARAFEIGYKIFLFWHRSFFIA